MDISTVPELAKADVSIRDFSVSPDGEVYMLGTDFGKERTVIVRFDSQGKYSSTIAIEHRFVPSRVTALRGGMLFVTGSELPFAPDAPREKRALAGPQPSFTAIVDQNGRLVRKLALTNDAAERLLTESKGEKPTAGQPARKAADVVPAPDARPAGRPEAASAEPAAKKTAGQRWDELVAFTKTSAALDGNVYLMRPSSPPLVYVISAGGDLLRRLQLKNPGEGFEAQDIAVWDSQIVIFFLKRAGNSSSAQVYSLFNAMTGEPITSYQRNPEMGGTPACYSARDGVTTLGRSATGKFQIVHAKP